MSTQAKPFLTPEQYLEIERQAEHKSEYYRGEMFAMAGVQRAHNSIVVNVIGELHRQLRSGPCELYPSDMRVKVSDSGLYTYPDSIIVGNPKFVDDNFEVLLNPVVLIEVLSPSTERYDRVFKSKLYQTIESLEYYLLIASEYMQVDLYSRQPDRGWLQFTTSQPDGVVNLPSVGCCLKLADLYERVEFRQNSR